MRSDSELSFYFYDLETSGFNPRQDRILQFAGQRTSMDFTPIGESQDFLIQLTSDVLPDPDAILVNGITPQRAREEGYSEREFAKILTSEISTPNTVFVGYNNLRFDDEFIRSLLYRNLLDPYEWQWKENRSRWDLLDVVRMTRALRPKGIQWPLLPNGDSANKLELITAANGISHINAHNALSDVLATIEVAKLLTANQPKLFWYLFGMRDKAIVRDFVSSASMFVYTSGKLEQRTEKTTIVSAIGDANGSMAYLYDLRYSPKEMLATGSDAAENPIVSLKYNHCPSIAPIGVMDEKSWQTIDLDKRTVIKNLSELKDLSEALLEKYADKFKYSNMSSDDASLDNVDELMYAKFVDAKDKKTLQRICDMSAEELLDFNAEFMDDRLDYLYFLYKARQLPKSLLAEDRGVYENYVRRKLTSGGNDSQFARYMNRLNELAKEQFLDADKRYILEELALYAESIIPVD